LLFSGPGRTIGRVFVCLCVRTINFELDDLQLDDTGWSLVHLHTIHVH